MLQTKMENRFKLRISSMFRSSFGSCRSKNIADVIEKPIFLPENRQHHQLIDLFSPKPRPFPSVRRQKLPQTELETRNINKDLKKYLLLSAENSGEGKKCPPASPISPLMIMNNNFYQFPDSATTSSSKSKEKKNRKTTRNKRVLLRSKGFGLHEFPACSYNGLFSSDEDDDEDDDKTTLFSSRSFSSDSSESFIRNKAYKSNRKAATKTASTTTTRQRRGRARNNEAAEMEASNPSMPELKGKVKDSFAVVKRSSDPYNDFRTSMVEMIVERQIFSAKDLENLLQCFLSLNSCHHHRVIIQVFTEIWEALFSNCSS